MPEGKDLVVYAHLESTNSLLDLLLFIDAFNRLGLGDENCDV